MIFMASTSHTATHWFIELALEEITERFQHLEVEMDSFVPRTRESFFEEEKREFRRLLELNPNSSPQAIEEMMRKQFDTAASPHFQIILQFNERYAAVAVSAVITSHALCEAVINTALAIGLNKVDKIKLFSVVESANLKHKWTAAPMSFLPHYDFPTSHHLHGTLYKLCNLRNSFVHTKPTMHSEGQKVLEGSKQFRMRMDKVGRKELRSLLELPYDLLNFLSQQVQDLGLKFNLEMILQRSIKQKQRQP